MSSYSSLSTLDHILDEYINNSEYRKLYNNNIDELVKYINIAGLRDDFLKRTVFYLNSDKTNFRDNLRNFVNGYDVIYHLVTSGFQHGKLNPVLSKTFLRNHLYIHKLVRNDGREKVYSLVLGPIILEIMRDHPCGSQIVLAILQRLQPHGSVKINLWINNSEVIQNGSCNCDISFLSVCLGLKECEIARFLLTSFPQGLDRGLEVTSYRFKSIFYKIPKIEIFLDIYSITWTFDEKHHQDTLDFVSKFIADQTILDKFRINEPKVIYIFQ